MTAVLLLLVLIILLLILGVSHVFYRELVAIRTTRPQLPGGLTTIRELQTQLESQHQTEIERLRVEARTTIGSLQSEVAALQSTLQVLSHETSSLVHQLPARAERTPEPDVEREIRNVERESAVDELYGQLSRLDTCFLQLANPVLLPGEPFVPADQLPEETLRWESWKDLGDRAFAFAEAVAERRLHLDEGLREETARFVALLREALTTHVYPALASGSRGDRAERTGKVEAVVQNLAVAIRDMRSSLERAHR